MLNSISIHGRLTKDPELKTTQSGVNVCTITVAVDRSYAKQGEEKQTDFFNVTCWRGTADIVSRYFSKGKEIIVHGAMQSRKYQDKNGNDRTAWEIQADGIDFCGSASNSNNSSAASSAVRSVGTATSNEFEPLPIPDKDLPF